MNSSKPGSICGFPIAPVQTGAYGPNPTAYQQRIRHLLDQGPAVCSPLPEMTSPLREKKHPSSCMCQACWNAGQHYADYLKNKALEDL
jgi:hypothetical protein